MAYKNDDLFRDLQPLAKPTHGKPDPHENLTDILELIAVASGVKPAHLQGQGQHDDARLVEVEQSAGRHGLRTLRTKGLVPFLHRPARVEQQIVEYELAEQREEQAEGSDVLWVYSDESVAAAIPDAVVGRVGVSRVLAYPECCVAHDSERKVLSFETYVTGIYRCADNCAPSRCYSVRQTGHREGFCQ